MALSQNVIRELKRELATLHNSRLEIEAKTIAIQKILAPQQIDTLKDHQPQAQIPNVITARPQRKAKKRMPRKGISLRQTVVEVVGQSPGMTTKDVTQVLRDRGISETGRTSLGDRVYHELYRMVRQGTMQRNGDGFVVLKPTNGAPTVGANDGSESATQR